MMDESDYPPLTFGIELELLAVWDDANCEPWQAVYYTLLGAGIPVIGGEHGKNFEKANDTHGKEFTHWRISEDNSVPSAGEKKAWPKDFVSAQGPDGPRVDCVELSSRKFRVGDEGWKGEVQRVLEVLAQIENLGCRFILNKTAGFHVHVRQEGGGFNLRVAKNLLQFCTAFERQLDDIHATNRILYPVEFYYDHWAISLSWFHQHNHTFVPETNMYDWLRTIEDLKTLPELRKFFLLTEDFADELDLHNVRSHIPMTHNSSLNIENLLPPMFEGHRSKGTFEFRQHAGTRDMLAIVHWVEVVTRITDFCRREDAEGFVSFVALGVDSTFELWGVLDAIGVGEKTIRYYCPITAATDDTIGFLGEEGQEARPEYTEKIDELMDVAEQEQNIRFDRTSAFRNATIAAKNYGYGSHLIIRTQDGGTVAPAIERLYGDLEATVEWKVVDNEVMREEAEWWVRRGVFDRLSAVLKASEMGLLEEQDVRDAETGPVVWIGRGKGIVQEMEELGLQGFESRYD